MSKENRITRQKSLIEKEINEMDSFFTSEQIFQKVKKKDSKIGIATVYRFLKNLKNNKLIHSYTCERKILYSKNQESHCHFICEKCNTTKHIDIAKIDFIKNKINGEICHFQIDIYGICQSCKK